MLARDLAPIHLLLLLFVGACGGSSALPVPTGTKDRATFLAYGWGGAQQLTLADDAIIALDASHSYAPWEARAETFAAVIPLDGSPARRLDARPWPKTYICMAADGEHLYWVYASQWSECLALSATQVYWVDEGAQTIFKADKGGGPPIPIAHELASELRVAGDHVYWNGYQRKGGYFTHGDEHRELWGTVVRLPLAGGRPSVLARPATQVRSRGRDDEGGPALRRVPLRGGPVETVWRPPKGGDVGAFAVSDDYYYVHSGRLLRIPRFGGPPSVVTDYPMTPIRLQLGGEMLYWAEFNGWADRPHLAPFGVIDGASLLALSVHGGRPVALIRYCETSDVLVRSHDVFAATRCLGLMRLPAWRP